MKHSFNLFLLLFFDEWCIHISAQKPRIRLHRVGKGKMCIQDSYKNLVFLIQDSYSSTFTGLEVLKNESELSKNEAGDPPFGLKLCTAMCAIVKGCTLSPRMKVRSKKASAEGSKTHIGVVTSLRLVMAYKSLILALLKNSGIIFRKERLCLT